MLEPTMAWASSIDPPIRVVRSCEFSRSEKKEKQYLFAYVSMTMHNASLIIRHHDRNNTSFVPNIFVVNRSLYRGFQDGARIGCDCGRRSVRKIINAKEDGSLFVIKKKNETLSLEDAGCVSKVNIF